MNNAELKEALLSECHVLMDHPVHGIFTYRRVSGIIYRRGEDGKIIISAELDSYCGSRMITKPEWVRKDE